MNNQVVSVNPNNPPINSTTRTLIHSIAQETSLALFAVLYLIYMQVVKPKIDAIANNTANSIQRGRVVNDILSQIGLLTNGDRVVLGLLHNGQISASGYHLTRMTITNSYSKPNVALNSTKGTVHIGIVINDLIRLVDAPNHANLIRRDEMENVNCLAYLNRNNINEMYNHLLIVGNLPIGVVSIQYVDDNKMEIDAASEKKLQKLLRDLEITLVNNLLRPNLFKLLLQRLGRKV